MPVAYVFPRSNTVEAPPELAWDIPAAVTVNAGTTTANIVWPTPMGGEAPYEYTDPGVIYDSAGENTTALFSTAGAGAGTTTVSGLVNGQTIIVQRTVMDAEGTALTVQAAVTVAATAAGITPGTAPASQTLPAGTTSFTIGTWGAPSGGTGPYTYAVTEASGGGTTITGSGLGAWAASGASDGQTYAFLLTITDALGAKGYSVVTVSVAGSGTLGLWEVVDETDFTDGNWTNLSSTSVAQSTTDWQHILYASDGTTPRAYIFNNSNQSRTLTLNSNGLSLTCGGNTTTPTIGVWPAGWTALLGGARRDAWLIEAVVEGMETSGVGDFVHISGISCNVSSAATTPGSGLRVSNTSSNMNLRVYSYISGFTSQAVQTVTAGSSRSYACDVQVTIADGRRHDVHLNVGATTFRDPQTGVRVRIQTAANTMTLPNADVTATFNWFATTILGRTKWWLYHDGANTSGYVRLKKLRLLRLPLGSL